MLRWLIFIRCKENLIDFLKYFGYLERRDWRGLKMFIGEKIKTCRMESGLSQEDLAEKLDTSRQTISSWENGKTYPSIKQITILSNLFNVSIEVLIKEDVEIMRESLDADEKAKKRAKNKDREVLNRLNFLRFILVFVGALLAYPVYIYFDGYWFLIPIFILILAVIVTIPIQFYRKKYDLHKYKDIVAFFDEKYDY